MENFNEFNQDLQELMNRFSQESQASSFAVENLYTKIVQLVRKHSQASTQRVEPDISKDTEKE